MEIQKLLNLEIDKLWAVYNECVEETQYFGSKWTKSQLLDEIVGGSVGLGIKKNELWAAILIVKEIDDAEIMWLGVRKAFRGQGLMGQLLSFYLKNVSLKFKNKKLILEVHEKNLIAYNFYKKFGFEEIGRRANYFSDGGDAQVMSTFI